MSHFVINENKGFQIKFGNGLTVSVQFGVGNYCERRDYQSGYQPELDDKLNRVESATAEIAVWGESSNGGRGKWARLGDGDTVRGWVEPDEVGDIIHMAAIAAEVTGSMGRSALEHFQSMYNEYMDVECMHEWDYSDDDAKQCKHCDEREEW